MLPTSVLRNKKVFHAPSSTQATEPTYNYNPSPPEEISPKETSPSLGTQDNQDLEQILPLDVQDSELDYGAQLEGASIPKLAIQEATHPSPSAHLNSMSMVIKEPESVHTTHHYQQEVTNAYGLEAPSNEAASLAGQHSPPPQESSTLENGENLGGATDDFGGGLEEYLAMGIEEDFLDYVPATPGMEHLDLVGDEGPYPPDTPPIGETPSYLQARLLSVSSDQSAYLAKAKVIILIPDVTSQKKQKPPSKSKGKAPARKPLIPPAPHIQKSTKKQGRSGSKVKSQGEEGSQGGQPVDVAAQIHHHLQAALKLYCEHYMFDEIKGKAKRSTTAKFDVSSKRFD
jgi:hypothetical protein